MAALSGLAANANPAVLSGDPLRARLRAALYMTSIAAVLFEVFAVGTKDVRALEMAAPWAEDPYDVVVSFGIFVVAGALSLAWLRASHFRVPINVHMSRVEGLRRTLAYVNVAILVVLVTAFISFFLSPPAAPGWLTVAQTLFVLLIAVVAGSALAQSRLRTASGIQYLRPDALDDVSSALVVVARRIPTRPARRFVVRILLAAASNARRRPLLAALLGSGSMGLFFAVGALLEGDPIILGILIGAIGTSAIFGLLALSASYLRLVATQPGGGRLTRAHLVALVTAAASVPITLAFREALWPLVLTTSERASITDLALLLAGGALVSGAVSYLAMSRLQRR